MFKDEPRPTGISPRPALAILAVTFALQIWLFVSDFAGQAQFASAHPPPPPVVFRARPSSRRSAGGAIRSPSVRPVRGPSRWYPDI